MPPKNISIKPEVLNQARRIFNRKLALAMEGTGKVPKPVCKKLNERGQEITFSAFDVRDPTDIAAFIIDTDNVPDDKKEEHFLNEAVEITKAFYTVDKKTNLPYPDAIKPYIKMVYDKTSKLLNTNWESAEEVAELLAANKASQSFATFVEDFANVIFELFPNVEDVRRIDSITGKATALFRDLDLYMKQYPDPDLVVDERKAEVSSQISFEDKLESELVHPVFDARIAESNTILLDALATDHTMKHFLNMDVSVESNGYTYDSDGYAREYLDTLARTYKKTSIEQMADNVVALSREEMSIHFDHLFINGKSISQTMLEVQEKQGCTLYTAQAIAGKMFTNALTDGKSIVTMLQVATAKDGKTEFRHQEIKVDLDALNKADKQVTNYSRFRRFLDDVGIWKIRRFKTNKARDAAQEKLRKSTNFRNALRAVEDKILDEYNSEKVRDKFNNRYPHIAEALPKFVRAEEVEKEKPIVNAPDRVQLTDVEKDLETIVAVEPKQEV